MPVAKLVVMEGENQEEIICELLGMDDSDSHLIKRYHTPNEKLYLNLRYPEYMGAIPAIIAKIASAAVGVGKSIAEAVKKKREQKKKSSEASKAAEQAKIAQYQYMMQLQAAEAAKKKKDNELLLLAGIPLALALIMLMRR